MCQRRPSAPPPRRRTSLCALVRLASEAKLYNYYDKRCVYTPTAFHLLLVLRTLLSQVARETKVREYLGGRSSMARQILLRGALRRSSSGADFAAGLMREAESLKACNRVLPDVISRSGSDRLTRLSRRNAWCLGTGDAGLHISVAISPPVNAGRSIGREISIRVC